MRPTTSFVAYVVPSPTFAIAPFARRSTPMRFRMSGVVVATEWSTVNVIAAASNATPAFGFMSPAVPVDLKELVWNSAYF